MGGEGRKRENDPLPDRAPSIVVSQTHKTPPPSTMTAPASETYATSARTPAHARATVILPPAVRKFANQLAARRAEQFEIEEAKRLKAIARRLLDSKLTPAEVEARLADD